MADDRSTIVMQMPTSANMALLQGLKRGNRYVFRVSTVNSLSSAGDDSAYEPQARSLSPPARVLITSRHKEGFQAIWIVHQEAIVSAFGPFTAY